MQTDRKARALARRLGFDPDYLAAFESKMFGDGENTERRLTNFFVLLLLATVIATYGVITDSTATVIGAMIVAPLMGPIMATAAAVVMGSTQRTLRSLALVITGVAAVILLSMLLSWLVPEVTIAFGDNQEIASRVTPGIVALLTALASGAAGAFISSREEIADSMGGVAIAISLVPPLCVVGIAIRLGEWQAAGGSLMLFLTNFLAILLAGGITFLLAGLGRLAVRKEDRRLRRSGFALIVIATVLVAVPLSVTSWQAIDRSLETRAASAKVEEWLEGTDYQTVKVVVGDPNVTAEVAGAGDLNSLTPLARELAKLLERPVKLHVLALPLQTEDSTLAQ